MSSTLICDEVFEEHDTGGRHPESPDRIRVIREGYENVEDPPWERREPTRKATVEELGYYHPESYVERVREASESGRSLDADTPTSSRSYEVARLAAGSALDLCEGGREESRAGFGAIRPPGHHAESETAMGFCLFNNIVLAAEQATRRGQTVAIVDIDVHHGNGTQNAFYDRSDVLYVSTHQSPLYPGTGAESETGAGKGEGYTLNLTFPAGADWEEYEPRWKGTILERLEEYDPDYLMVSAGFDAHRTDPIGGLNLDDEAYLTMAGDLNEISRTHCEGRLLGLLEGGYNLGTLERLVPTFTDRLLRGASELPG